MGMEIGGGLDRTKKNRYQQGAQGNAVLARQRSALAKSLER
jgi:hypothetical protein